MNTKDTILQQLNELFEGVELDHEDDYACPRIRLVSRLTHRERCEKHGHAIAGRRPAEGQTSPNAAYGPLDCEKWDRIVNAEINAYGLDDPRTIGHRPVITLDYGAWSQTENALDRMATEAARLIDEGGYEMDDITGYPPKSYLSSIGTKGGKSGTGDAKRRGDSEHYRKVRAAREAKKYEGMAPCAFSAIGETKVGAWLDRVIRPEYLINRDSWISEIFNRASDRAAGTHEPGYEAASSATISGRPETIEFTNADFDWEKID